MKKKNNSSFKTEDIQRFIKKEIEEIRRNYRKQK